MYPDALIVADDYDCKKHISDLVEHCASFNLKAKVINRNHWPNYFNKSLAHHTRPILYYGSPSYLHSSDWDLLRYHKNNDIYSIIITQQQEVATFRPDKVTVSEDGRFWLRDETNKPFKLKDVSTQYKLPSVDPVTIIVIAHKRNQYLQLTLNGLFHSLGPRAEEVPIIIVINSGDSEIKKLSESYLKYSNVEILIMEPNTGLGANHFAIKWLKTFRNGTKNIMILEEDFILPSAVKEVYRDWPWWFAHRLQFFDIVCWLPSLDNLPTIFQNQTRFTTYTDIKEVSRKSPPANFWIDSTNNENMFITGNAFAYSLDFYELTQKTISSLAPTDYNFLQIAHRISSPKLFGYHIGWNQNQDGYTELHDKDRWEEIPKEVTISALMLGTKTKFDY